MPVERIDVDDTPDRLQATLHNARYAFALERVPPSARVLEIGTGAGGMTVQLVAKCKDYTGIDFDPVAIEQTRKKVGNDVRIVQADAKKLPFCDNQFTHIVCLEVLEHLGDWIAGVNEIARCLSEDGTAIVSVPYRRKGGRSESNPYHLYEPDRNELRGVFGKKFKTVEMFSQYFHESWFETCARVLHVRRFIGLSKMYCQLTEGDPSVTCRLEIGKKARGMKIGILLVAESVKKK